MKLRIIRIICVIVVIGFSIFIFNNYYNSSDNYQNLEYGILDNVGTFDASDNIDIDHTFAVWDVDGTDSIISAVENLNSSNDRDLLITVEPWPQFEESGLEMFFGITNGRYDQIIQDTCIELQNQTIDKTVYLRIGHEMDLAETSRYPWATDNHEEFVDAYRYIISKCRQYSQDVKYVWSPAGKENADLFYPGDDWVDYTSISFFGYPDFEKLDAGRTFNFIDLFFPKYQRMKKYNKPIFISETAVAGDSGYKQEWMNLALETIEKREDYPLLKAFVYFNSKDNIRWDPSLEEPDFTIPEFLYP